MMTSSTSTSSAGEQQQLHVEPGEDVGVSAEKPAPPGDLHLETRRRARHRSRRIVSTASDDRKRVVPGPPGGRTAGPPCRPARDAGRDRPGSCRARPARARACRPRSRLGRRRAVRRRAGRRRRPGSTFEDGKPCRGAKHARRDSLRAGQAVGSGVARDVPEIRDRSDASPSRTTRLTPSTTNLRSSAGRDVQQRSHAQDPRTLPGSRRSSRSHGHLDRYAERRAPRTSRNCRTRGRTRAGGGTRTHGRRLQERCSAS